MSSLMTIVCVGYVQISCLHGGKYMLAEYTMRWKKLP